MGFFSFRGLTVWGESPFRNLQNAENKLLHSSAHSPSFKNFYIRPIMELFNIPSRMLHISRAYGGFSRCEPLLKKSFSV